jgi:hypothetical protein
MSTKKPQTYKNHGRFDPLFHFILVPILVANVVCAIVFLVHHPHWRAAWLLVLSVAAVFAMLKVRIYALKVQDRIIRLEERLRLQALAPAPWQAQIYRLTEDQLIGLRFASDAEVVELAKQAVELNLNRKQIKQRIQNWRADEFRV